MPTRPIQDGSDGTWGDELNAWLDVGHNPDGTVKTEAIPLPPTAIAVEKVDDYTLAPGDNGSRFIFTATATVTVPVIGTLGNGFFCEVLNDSGSTVTIDGTGSTNATLTDGQVASVLEVGGKQQVIIRTTSSIVLISDVETPPVTQLWTPSVLGTDPTFKGLDCTHWWDAQEPSTMTFDATSGKLTKWLDRVASFDMTQTIDTRRPSVQSGEVRFSGILQTMTIKSFTRAPFENWWIFMIFRINWTGSGAGGNGNLLCINGVAPAATAIGRSQPRVEYLRTAQQVQTVWTHTDQRGGDKGSAVVENKTPVSIAGSDVWHTMLARRVPTGAYISIDGATETFVAGAGSMPRLPSDSEPTGFLGDNSASNNLVWGLDSLIIGQKDLTATERQKMHAWGLHRKGAQSQLPGGNPYLVNPPVVDSPAEIHQATHDSYSTGVYLGNISWDQSTRGGALNLTGFTETFSDHFTDVATTITDGCAGAGPWYAPGNRADTSAARFASPVQAPLDTFSQYDATTLQIHLQFSNTGFAGAHWYSGHIQTVNTWGNGFSQACPVGGACYFESRMAFHNTNGWPAFWTYTPYSGQDTTKSLLENDIMECYGSGVTSPKQLHTSLHRHPALRPQQGNQPTGTSGVPGASKAPSNVVTMTVSPWNVPTLFDGTGTPPGVCAPGTFHTYGMMIDATWITMYFDGLVVSRYPTFSEALGEQYLLVSLQAQDTADAPVVETFLWVDYVKVYEKP